MTIRLFLALEITDEVRENLAKLQAILKTAAQFSGAQPSWVSPESTHLTVRFLGNTQEEMVDLIAQRLEQSLASFEPFAFAVRGTGVFPDPRRPKVLWAGVKKADEQLAALFELVEQEMAPIGFETEERAYHPHLTLARIKSQKGIQGMMQAVEQNGRFWCGEVQAEELVLFRSDLNPSGAIYTPLRRFPFSKG